MRRVLFALPLAALACTPTTTTNVELPLLGGYRDTADQCQRVGENDFTNQYLGDATDLVACPKDYEGTGVFVTETGATKVNTVGDWELYTVPRG